MKRVCYVTGSCFITCLNGLCLVFHLYVFFNRDYVLIGADSPPTSVPVLTSTKTSFSLQIFYINLLESLTVRIAAIGLQYIGHQDIGHHDSSNL